MVATAKRFCQWRVLIATVTTVQSERARGLPAIRFNHPAVDLSRFRVRPRIALHGGEDMHKIPVALLIFVLMIPMWGFAQTSPTSDDRDRTFSTAIQLPAGSMRERVDREQFRLAPVPSAVRQQPARQRSWPESSSSALRRPGRVGRGPRGTGGRDSWSERRRTAYRVFADVRRHRGRRWIVGRFDRVSPVVSVLQAA